MGPSFCRLAAQMASPNDIGAIASAASAPFPTHPQKTGQTAASRRRSPRLPALHTGSQHQGSAAQLLHTLFAQICEISRQAEQYAQKAAEVAVVAAAIASGTPHQASSRNHGLRRHQSGRHKWEPHGWSSQQETQLAALASRARKLCVLHRACAEELVTAVAALPGRRLQHMLVRHGHLIHEPQSVGFNRKGHACWG